MANMKTLHIALSGQTFPRISTVYGNSNHIMMEHRHVTGQIIIVSLNLFPFQVSFGHSRTSESYSVCSKPYETLVGFVRCWDSLLSEDSNHQMASFCQFFL